MHTGERKLKGLKLKGAKIEGRRNLKGLRYYANQGPVVRTLVYCRVQMLICETEKQLCAFTAVM